MRRRRASRVAWLIGAWGVLSLAACSPTKPTTDGPPPEVKVRDIAPTEPLGPPGEGAAANSGSRLAYRVQRVEVDLDRPLNLAWSLIDESPLPPIKRAVWENNGLRLGTLDAADAGELGESLAPTRSTQASTLINITEPTSVRSSARLNRPVPIDLTVPPMNVRREWADSGRIRLLMREADVTPGGVEVELTPQLYRPKAQLLPRSPGQRELDGRLYDALAVTVTIRPRELLIIGLNWPWETPEPIPNFLDDDTPPDESLSSDPPASQPPDGSEPPPPAAVVSAEGAVTPQVEVAPAEPPLEAPPLPVSIGRALFTGQRFGRPVQLLLVISVDDGSLLIESPSGR